MNDKKSKIASPSKGKSPALDLAMKLMFDFPNKIINEKVIKITITERQSFVDFLITDTSENPDKKLEALIFKTLKPIIQDKYKIHPESWDEKRID